MKHHQRFKIVSFYTPDYEHHARKLEASIQEHLPNVSYGLEAIPQRKWAEATCFKAEFLLEQLKGSDVPVVWVDADAAVMTPSLTFPDVDFAVYSRFADPVRVKMGPFRTGTVYFGKSEKAVKLLEWWKRKGETQKDGIDQWSLFRAWCESMQRKEEMPSTVWLPKSYCRKFDEDGPVKVLHFMASRKLKRSK